MAEASNIENGLWDDIHELVHAQLEGRATTQQRDDLERLVCGNQEARQIYVEYIRDSANLHLSSRAEGDQQAERFSQLLQLASTADGNPRTDHGASEKPASTNLTSFLKRFRWLPAMAAAGVVVAASYSMFALWSPQAAVAPVPVAPVPVAPVPVARVRQMIDADWSRDGHSFIAEPGDTLLSGKYVLDAGLARIVFPWGTEVTLEAPAEIDLRPDGTRLLVNGQLVAKVANEDKGFTIDTPAVKVIDLGTEFGVSVANDGESEVHVFHGEVEARQLGSDDGTPGTSMRLTARHATSFHVEDHSPQDIIFNPRRFSRAWQAASQVTQTDGAVHFMHPPPESVVEGQTEANDALLVFLEREGVALSDVTAVTLTQPGLYTTFVDRAAWLPAEVEVDSYLIHFDPVGSANLQAPVTAKGSVTFNRPILAVITRGDQLALSDGDCACPGTSYLGPLERYLDFYPRGLQGLVDSAVPRASAGANDSIRLSPDRRTLTIKCTAGGETDQLRVLVSAEGEADSLPKLEAPSLAPSRPFLGQPFSVGQIIQAEDFDQGGPGVGYYDSTPNMLAVYYRPGESVELVRSEEGDSVTTYVGRTRMGEWLAYSLDVPEAGNYVIEVRVASSVGGGRFRVEFGESSEETQVVIPLTDGHTTFQTIKSQPVMLPAGLQVMRVIMETHHAGEWVGNIDWLRVNSASAD